MTLLASSIVLAQNQTPPPPPRPSFDELCDKFTRNMQLLEPLLDDLEAANLMKIVISQTADVKRFYLLGGAKEYRERLIDHHDQMKIKPTIRKSDQERAKTLGKSISERDPDKEFPRARGILESTMENLKRSLDQIYSSDQDEMALAGLVKGHIDHFKAALSRTKSAAHTGQESVDDQVKELREMIEEELINQ